MIRLSLSIVVAFIVAGFVLAACGGGGAQSFAEACQKSDQKQFSNPPDLIIDTSKTYFATIKTAKGDIVLELFSDVPITTSNFAYLACKGFYDGLSFHRVVPGFVAQGGDPAGNCKGGPGYTIPDEPDNGHTFEAGVISMAKPSDATGRAVPNSAGSQFFLTYTSQPDLEQDFTVFGRLQAIQGMAVLQRLAPRECGDRSPAGDVIETITIEERDGAGVAPATP
ncbi:MAG: peptidylprolyl isomerase [Dehalococcoidia bacterium]